MEVELEGSKQDSPSSESIPSSSDREDKGCKNANFEKLWREVTDDNYLTLYGFQRYRTIHLLNLRFMEAEIKEINHNIYQASISLNHIPTLDKLGLKHVKKDVTPATIEEAVNPAIIVRLRGLLKQYGIHTSQTNYKC